MADAIKNFVLLLCLIAAGKLIASIEVETAQNIFWKETSLLSLVGRGNLSQVEMNYRF